MTKRIKRIVSVMIGICLVLTATGTAAWADSLQLNKTMSLTVQADYEGADGLCYDLYKLADVTGPGFAFQTVDAYSELSGQIEQASSLVGQQSDTQWSDIAQLALQAVLGDNAVAGSAVTVPANADRTGLLMNTKYELSAGLYLLVARGVDGDNTVITSVQSEDADGSGLYEEAQLATCTTVEAQNYTILPQLICLPTKLSADTTSGSWVYDQTISLKMTVSPAMGSILLDKKLVGYYGTENATFVFQVDTYYPTADELYSSEVYAMTFTAAGEQTLQIDNIPIGSYVSVSEVYSGANYTSSVSSTDSVSLVVSDTQPQSVVFTNTYNGHTSGGGGVSNHFTYQIVEGVGSWHWEQQ